MRREAEVKKQVNEKSQEDSFIFHNVVAIWSEKKTKDKLISTSKERPALCEMVGKCILP